MTTERQQSYFERLQYPRSIALGFTKDQAGASFRDAFGVPFHFEPAYLDPSCCHGYTGRFSYLQFPGHLGVYDCSFEPAFIRKRNERERQRVRCVNEGYARLREHLPQEFEDKRLSKVETLRAAINYIKHLQRVLELHVSDAKDGLRSPGNVRSPPRVLHQAECNSDGESRNSLSDCGETNC
ncbi:achaete-scute homolog 4-like [Brienomyrus brachyistius]|uniref:achaete-scute homolog 4-like n=1 Tax=Brienomyrus brachyistius TaxID=42636 RepID=UPI0020B2D3FD|nr:achaete-scute homolog 4-like [Brienomyrus brachyistius]